MSTFKDGYALIVGIAGYSKVRRLPKTVLKDARDVHRLLRSSTHCGYSDAQVRLLLDDQATADGIRDGLRWLAGVAGTGDTALVFFSGHGGRVESGSQAGNYIVPFDCDPADLPGTAIPGNELTGLLRDVQAQRVLVLFDCCYSGGTGEPKGLGPEPAEFKSGLEESYYEHLAQGAGRVIMASSRSDEESLVLHGMDNSLFTHYLLKALRGSARTRGDGLIRVFDIFDYVSEEVPTRGPQHPIFKAADLENNFAIALYLGGKQVEPAPGPAQPSRAATGKRVLGEAVVHTRLHSLATFIRQRRETGEPPYVLVLGAGASLASGAASTARIVETVVQEYRGLELAGLSWEEKLAAFFKVLDGVSAEERYLILSRHLKGAQPSPGYHHLAALVKAGCFDTILTTNFDLFLENALMDAGLRAQEFTVLVNGQDQEDHILRALKYPAPKIKILKLHGDLNARLFAFTPQEVFQFADRIERTLTEMLNGDIVVVGHSLRDDDLNRCIRASGGALWYVNPAEPSPADFARRAMVARGTSDHIISGELGRFDEFLAWLHLELLLPLPLQVSDPKERRSLADLDDCRRRGDHLGMAAALETLARIYAQAGHKERAEVCYDRAVALLEGLGDLQRAARVLRALGRFHAGLNRPFEALSCYHRSHDLSRETADPQGLAQSLAMMGQCWRAVHKLEKAIPYWEQALAVPDGLGEGESKRVARWLHEAQRRLGTAEEAPGKEAEAV